MKKALIIPFILISFLAIGQQGYYPLPNTHVEGHLNVDDSVGIGTTAPTAALNVITQGTDKVVEVKDTVDGASSAWLQVYGSGSVRTGLYQDYSGIGFTNGTEYPYLAMPAGSFVSGINNRILNNLNPLKISSSVSGFTNTIDSSLACVIDGGIGNYTYNAERAAINGGTSNTVSNAINVVINGGIDNTIDSTLNSVINGGVGNSVRGTSSAISASTQCYIELGSNNVSITASSESRADSALAFVASSFQSASRSDHGTVLNGYRAYASYYHQIAWGSQPVVDTTGFTFSESSSWQPNNKTFTIGNGGFQTPAVTMTNSLTQIANGNMLIGTHWRNVYDDLDTSSAILTVMNDSVGGDDIFVAVNKDRDTTLVISEDAALLNGQLTIVDGSESDGYVLTSDANGLASWQLSGGTVATRIQTLAGNVTLTSGDYFVGVNKSVGAATQVDLPATPATGRVFIIKDAKGDANANNITIVPNAGNIDGAGNYVINTNYGSVNLIYNGTEWNVF